MKVICGLIAMGIFTLTGCFNVVHYIEVKKDKSVYVDYRLTTVYGKDEYQSKKEKESNDEIFGDMGVVKSLNPVIKDISDDVESGFEITCTAPESAQVMPNAKAKIPLIPYHDKKGQYVLVSYGTMSEDDKTKDTDKMAAAVFASARYQVILNGAFVPRKAMLVTSGKEGLVRYYPNIYTLGKMTFIDMPGSLMLLTESALILSPRETVDDKEITSYFAKRTKERELREQREQKEQEEQERKENAEMEKARKEKESVEENPGDGETAPSSDVDKENDTVTDPEE